MASISTAGDTRALRERPVHANTNAWETRMWQFMRISGAALIPLALGHLAIMHLINNVHIMNTCFVALRWAYPAWRIYDAALLGFALVHGLNGVRYSIDDYIHPPALNRALKWALVIVGGLIFIAGTIALIGGVQGNPALTCNQ